MDLIKILGKSIDLIPEKSFTVEMSLTPAQFAFLNAPQPDKTWGDCQLCNQWSMILAVQNSKNVCPACWEFDFYSKLLNLVFKTQDTKNCRCDIKLLMQAGCQCGGY